MNIPLFWIVNGTFIFFLLFFFFYNSLCFSAIIYKVENSFLLLWFRAFPSLSSEELQFKLSKGSAPLSLSGGLLRQPREVNLLKRKKLLHVFYKQMFIHATFLEVAYNTSSVVCGGRTLSSSLNELQICSRRITLGERIHSLTRHYCNPDGPSLSCHNSHYVTTFNSAPPEAG